jgi:hypothetical protein
LARAKTVTPNDFAAVLAEATLAFQQKRFVDAAVSKSYHGMLTSAAFQELRQFTTYT